MSDTPKNCPRLIRRRTVLLAAPGVLLSRAAHALAPTPAQSEGPFYPRAIPDDHDNDLTLFAGRAPKGEVIEMVGRVFDLKGAPAAGARVEIWHCDPAGIYPHVGRNNGALADPDFQGFGAVTAGPDGSYRFRTIRPGLYPGRVRHIHVKAGRQSGAELTTQMYFPEEDNGRDFLYRRGGGALIARRIDGPPVRYVFDIVLA